MADGVAACAEILLKGKVIRMKKKLSFLLALVMLFSSLSALAEGSVLENFLAPDAIAKPMARMWFPDASAGVDENDTIAKQINALAEAGFGGVEIAFLADGSNYTNEQLDYSHATRLNELGVDDKSIQHWEGHASQDTTTKIYIKQTNDRTERAGKILSNFALEADPCAHLVPFLGEDENAENVLCKNATEYVNPMRV